MSTLRLCWILTVLWAGGCTHSLLAPAVPPEGIEITPEAPLPENPIFVPHTDREFVWLQIVDTVDDYFHIMREDRVRVVGGVLTEGRIETAPRVGATILEPWHCDSTPGYERLHSTLQSIRRRCEVHVLPVSDGYTIEVLVFKELEDVSQPEHATVGGSTLRHDGSLVRFDPNPEAVPATLGWIALGRDISLEARLLQEMQGRLAVTPVH